MKIFADYRSTKNNKYDHIELCYSWFHWISGNDPWFCRIWKKNWVNLIANTETEQWFGQSYGKNKFEAYRKALENLK